MPVSQPGGNGSNENKSPPPLATPIGEGGEEDNALEDRPGPSGLNHQNPFGFLSALSNEIQIQFLLLVVDFLTKFLTAGGYAEDLKEKIKRILSPTQRSDFDKWNENLHRSWTATQNNLCSISGEFLRDRKRPFVPSLDNSSSSSSDGDANCNLYDDESGSLSSFNMVLYWVKAAPNVLQKIRELPETTLTQKSVSKVLRSIFIETCSAESIVHGMPLSAGTQRTPMGCLKYLCDLFFTVEKSFQFHCRTSYFCSCKTFSGEEETLLFWNDCYQGSNTDLQPFLSAQMAKDQQVHEECIHCKERKCPRVRTEFLSFVKQSEFFALTMDPRSETVININSDVATYQFGNYSWKISGIFKQQKRGFCAWLKESGDYVHYTEMICKRKVPGPVNLKDACLLIMEKIPATNMRAHVEN